MDATVEPLEAGAMLTRLIEHDAWANARLIEACRQVDDARLDAAPRPGAWSLREILVHIVVCEHGYLQLLTRPLGERAAPEVAYDGLLDAAAASARGLLALAADLERDPPRGPIHTSDGYEVAPWVVLLQALNHAGDHRRQAAGMLRDLGITPPGLDGWTYGEAKDALRRLPA